MYFANCSRLKHHCLIVSRWMVVSAMPIITTTKNCFAIITTHIIILVPQQQSNIFSFTKNSFLFLHGLYIQFIQFVSFYFQLVVVFFKPILLVLIGALVNLFLVLQVQLCSDENLFPIVCGFLFNYHFINTFSHFQQKHYYSKGYFCLRHSFQVQILFVYSFFLQKQEIFITTIHPRVIYRNLTLDYHFICSFIFCLMQFEDCLKLQNCHIIHQIVLKI